MVPWRSYPVIRLLLPYIGGIIAAGETGSPGPSLFLALGLWLLAAVLQLIRPAFMEDYSFRWLPGFLVQSMLFFTGHHMGSDVSLYQSFDHYTGLMGPADQVYVVQLMDEPVAKGRSMVCTGTVRRLAAGGSAPARCHGRVRLMFARDDASLSLHYGDKLMVASDPFPVSGPDNPYAFDFRKHLSYRHIFHQFYLRNGDYARIESGGNILIILSVKMRLRLRKIMEDRGIRDQRLGLANAMLLGSKELIDADTLEGFSRAGAMHILCVSGLHVGIVYLMLSLLIPRRLFRGRVGFAWPVMILTGIWGYAFLTGLSPSVQRAAVMFTMMSAGSHFRRSGNIFNNLAGSALFLLLVHPQILFYVGFQLSYLAVAGIALFEKPLASLIRTRRPIAEKTWRLVTVSLAAQAGTAPLAMFYFHAFPVYFLLTNLVVIPLSSLIIYAAVMLIALNPFDVLSNFIATCLDLLLKALDLAVNTIQSLPGSVIEPVHPGMDSMILMYLSIITCYLVVKSRKKAYLHLLFYIVVLLLACFYYAEWRSSGQRRMFIYKARSSTAIDLFIGKHCIFLHDSGFVESGLKESFIAGGNRDARLVRKTTRIEIDGVQKMNDNIFYFRYPLLVFHGKSFLIVTERAREMNSLPCNACFDFLLILDCKPTVLESLLSKVEISGVILSSSVPNYRVALLKEICSRAGKPCWSVWYDGAREIVTE